MSNNRGLIAEEEVALGLQMLSEARPIWHSKFPDRRTHQGREQYLIQCPKCTHRFEFISPYIPLPVPADFLAITPNIAALVEVKSSKQTSLPTMAIRPHQVDASVEVGEMQPVGRGLFVITRREPRPIVGWSLTGAQMARLLKEADEEHRHSIPWSDISGMGRELRRFTVKAGVSYFDLSEILK